MASLAMGAGSIIAALGAEQALVGSDLGSDVDAEVLNPAHLVNVERLIELAPDLVFVDSTEADERALEAIEAIGAEMVVLEPAVSLDDSMAKIQVIATELGIPERAAELEAQINAQIALLDTSLLQGKTIAFLYLRGSAGVYLIAGEGSGADDLIEALGAIDAGSSAGVTGFAPITAEQLLNVDPDFFLVMEKGLESIGGVSGLLALPGVSGTNAGKTGSVLIGEDSSLLSLGPDTPRVLACIIEQVSD